MEMREVDLDRTRCICFESIGDALAFSALFGGKIASARINSVNPDFGPAWWFYGMNGSCLSRQYERLLPDGDYFVGPRRAWIEAQASPEGAVFVDHLADPLPAGSMPWS